MLFTNFNNQDLITGFGKLVQTERKITAQVLEFILEIERRKIYLDLAFASLFDYLTKEFGYSPAAAMRRIQSARLVRELPEVLMQINSGQVNLSKISFKLCGKSEP